MPRNIEIKASIRSLEDLGRRAAAVADQGPFALDQDDTFFACESGRLKLRAFSSESGELIFYRLNENEPTEAGIREAHELMARLGVESSQLIDGAHVDLLARKSA
jgi:adenylate cyclase class IV